MRIGADAVGTPDCLFVYGTLRRGAPGSRHGLLQEAAEGLGPATWPGRLYRVAHYPGAVASDAAGDLVRGELYAIRPGRGPDLLARLDRYEGSDYRREPTRVRRPDGTTRVAWIYVYVRPVAGLTRIGSGDFLAPTP